MAALKRLLQSPSLFAAVVYGVGGIGFAGANLILARQLEPMEFAVFALALAIVNFSVPTAPLGLDGVILRRGAPVSRMLAQRMLLASSMVAVAAIILGGVLYELSTTVLLLSLVAIMSGGATMTAAAMYQSRQRFHTSLPLAQSSNIALLAVALVAWTAGAQTAVVPLAMLAAAYAMIAVTGWRPLSRESTGAAEPPFGWGEALAYAGAHVALYLLVQLDRLVIPHVLPLEELAHYAVVAAVVGSGFRVLQMGVGHTLVPLMRAAPDARTRRRLLRREAMLVALIVAVSSAAAWYVAPPVMLAIVGDEYEFPRLLIFAAIVTGVAKVLGSLTRAPVVALGSARDLVRLNVLGWVCVVLGATGGALGARWELGGVILGVSLGWWVWAVAAGMMSLPYIRREAKPARSLTMAVDEAGTQRSPE